MVAKQLARIGYASKPINEFLEFDVRFAIVATLLTISADAAACSFARQTKVEFDAKYRANIESRPVVPTITLHRIRRGRAHDGVWNWSCNDTGLISMRMPLNEETKDLVFAFRMVSGSADELTFRDGFYAGYTREGFAMMGFTFPWVDGAVDAQEPLDFVLEITPATRSGQLGHPKMIRISYPME